MEASSQKSGHVMNFISRGRSSRPWCRKSDRPGSRPRATGITALLGALFMFLPPGSASAEPVTQGKWAQLLVEAMGLVDAVAVGEPTTKDFIDFLSGKPAFAQKVWATSLEPFPPGAVRVPDPAREDHVWVRATGHPVTAAYRVNLSNPGIYAIRFRGKGGAQDWRVGRGTFRRVVPGSGPEKAPATNGGSLDLVGYFLLPRGEQRVTVELPAGGSLLSFEILRQPFPHVRPPGGWQPEVLLTFGDKAITMIQAMELEHELPDISRWRVEREGERYDEGQIPAQRMTAGSVEKPSAGAWLKGAAEGSRVIYILPVARRGTYSLLARVTGTGEGKVLLNNLVERGWRGPKPKDHLVWRNLATLPLEKGEQTLEIALDSDAGLDVMRLIYRDPSPEASLMLLDDLGFEESAPEDLVTVNAALENLDNSSFQERIRTLLASFYTQPGTGIGPPSGAPPIVTPGLILTEPGEVIPTDSSPKISP